MEKADIFFPDDIVIEILSRLPAKTAFQCRFVCRKWRDLTSTVDFMELHMRRSIPMMLVVRFVSNSGAGVFSNFLLDKWWEQKSLVHLRFRLGLPEPARSFRNAYWAKFSHGGLVVFRNRGGPLLGQRSIREILILNPTSYENVKIILLKELWSSDIYGIFFNHSQEEYCTLWRLHLGGKVFYKLLNLGSKPCWREISNPWSHRDKVKATCPLLIGEYLYWLVKPEQEYDYGGRGNIMVYDIISEKFSLIQWPVPLDVHCEESRINLLDIGGALSFVLTSQDKQEVTVSIWKLKDVERQLWIYTNNSIRVEDCLRSKVSRTTAVVGEMLTLLLDERLYVCDLRLGRTCLKKKYNDDDHILASSHVMSLASLKNYKSKIYMDLEGEVGEESDMVSSLRRLGFY